MSWLDNYSITNTFRSMYINGFIDISGGRLQTRSATDGHLFIAGDTSLNGNLYVGGDISWNPNSLANDSIPSSAIIGGVGGSGLDTDADLSLNKRLFVGEDVILNQSLIVAGDVSLNQSLTVAGDVSFNGSAFLGGDVLTATGLYEFNISFGNSPSTTQLGSTFIGTTNTRLGRGISINDDGTIIAIASPGEGTAGKVQVYGYDSGTSSWSQIGSDMTDSNSSGSFGRCIALNGDGTIVGITAQGVSTVYVYQYSGGSWSLLGSGTSTVVWDNAFTISNDGTKFAVGHFNSPDTGSVTAYEYDSGTNSWTQMGSTILGQNSGDRNGTSISFDETGTILAIGAVRHAGDNGSRSGQARVFQYSNSSWNQIGGDIDGEAAHDQSGMSVSLNTAGNILVIGALFNDGNGNDSGHARVYQYDATKTSADTDQNSATFGPIGWNRLGGDIDGPSASARFGSAVSINSTGDLIVVGATNYNSNGIVYAYYYSSGTWTQIGDSMSITGPYCGYRVALSKKNSVLIFSSELSNNRGSAAIYEIESTVTNSEIYSSSGALVSINNGTMRVNGDISWNPTSLANDSIPSSAIIGGAAGATGAAGPTGAAGATGAAGVAGATGAAGADGATGPQGEKGEPPTARSYSVTAAGGYYYIDGVQQDSLHLIRGQTYIFNLNVSGHPFFIQTSSTSYNSANVYNSGVTNNGATTGSLTITVPYDAPNTLYYVCQYHSGMGGSIEIVNLSGDGLKGEKGDTGSNGTNGATGPQGEKGDTGSNGADGATGAVGPTGVAGSGLDTDTDLSLNKRLFVGQDVSLNSNLYVGGDISWNPNSLANDSIPSSAIIGGIGGSGLDTDTDLSLNKRLFVGQDVSLNSNLYVGEDVTLNKRLFVSEDVSLNQSLFVKGNALLGTHYNRLVSSIAQTTFGSNETTTQLVSIGAFFIYNQPTTNGSTATIHNGSDSHIGESVAISDDGTIVAIAAPGGKFHNYNRFGYVEIRQNNGSSWSRIGLLIGNNTLSNPMFGRCIALNGDGTILATYARETVNSVVSNVVKVYQYSAGSWSQLGSDITDGNRPGYTHDQLSFNTTGTILAIGDGNDNTVRIYEYSSGSWSQLGSDIVGEASDDALSKVSLNSSGSIIAVGAELNDGNGGNSGHVRVFEYSAGSWSQLGGDIDGEAANDRAGVSVSIDATGTIVAIGAYGNDQAGNSAGHIRVYQYDANKTNADTDQSSATFGPIGWNRLGTDIDGSNAHDGLGRTVSLNGSGDTLAVGALNANNSYGYVRMYHYSSGSWTQVGTQQNGTRYQDFAGRAVAISKNNTIIVYGACDTSYDRTDVGSAKVYQVSKTELLYDSNGVLQTDDTYRSDRGLVGIGITNPSYEVDISGTIQVSGDISASGLYVSGDISASGLYVSGDISWNPNNLANNSIPSSAIIPEFMLLSSTGGNNGLARLDNIKWDIHGTTDILGDLQAIIGYGTSSLIYNGNHTVSALTLNFKPGIYKVTVSGKVGTRDTAAMGFDLDNDNKIAYSNAEHDEEEFNLDSSVANKNYTFTHTFVVSHNANFHFVERDNNTWYDYSWQNVQILFEKIGIPQLSGTDDTLHSYGGISIVRQVTVTGGITW